MTTILTWTFRSVFSLTDMHERLSGQVSEITWTLHESEAYGGTYLHGKVSSGETVKIILAGDTLWEMEWWGEENVAMRDRILHAIDATDVLLTP